MASRALKWYWPIFVFKIDWFDARLRSKVCEGPSRLLYVVSSYFDWFDNEKAGIKRNPLKIAIIGEGNWEQFWKNNCHSRWELVKRVHATLIVPQKREKTRSVFYFSPPRDALEFYWYAVLSDKSQLHNPEEMPWQVYNCKSDRWLRKYFYCKRLILSMWKTNPHSVCVAARLMYVCKSLTQSRMKTNSFANVKQDLWRKYDHLHVVNLHCIPSLGWRWSIILLWTHMNLVRYYFYWSIRRVILTKNHILSRLESISILEHAIYR